MDQRRARWCEVVRARIYAEGGGPPDDEYDSEPGSEWEREEITNKSLHIQCREGFTKLIAKCGFDSSSFQVNPCGPRGTAWKDFQSAHQAAAGRYYVWLLVDSEAQVEDVEEPWDHLRKSDNWHRPEGADDDQVLLMTRSMEAWIAADHRTLREYFPDSFDSAELPDLEDLEDVSPGRLVIMLEDATQNCYSKGSNSFDILARLNPDTLQEWLPSFRRAVSILGDKLEPSPLKEAK